jgi:hypothetical protein
MNPLRTVAPLALFALAAGAPAAEDSHPVAMQVQALAESPFTLSVPAARLIRQADGVASLAFDVRVTNTDARRRVTIMGWSLDVSSAQGELRQRVHLASGATIEPLQSRLLSYRLGGRELGPVTAGSTLVIRAASAGVSDN